MESKDYIGKSILEKENYLLFQNNNNLTFV